MKAAMMSCKILLTSLKEVNLLCIIKLKKFTTLEISDLVIKFLTDNNYSFYFYYKFLIFLFN